MKINFEAIKKISLKNFLWLALGAIFIMNIAIILQNKSIVSKKKAIADEVARPADISISIIKDSSCTDCASLDPYINEIKRRNVKVTKEETLEAKGDEGKKLIEQFAIKKLPTFVVKGELAKFDDFKNLLTGIGKVDNDTFVFTSPVANFPIVPYLDLASGQVKGRVSITMISDKNCKECTKTSTFVPALATAGIANPVVKADLDRADSEAQKMIWKYRLTTLPTFILNGEVAEYEYFARSWPLVGTVEKDGSYILRNAQNVQWLTYIDLKTGKVAGLGVAKPTPSPSPSPKPTPSPSPK